MVGMGGEAAEVKLEGVERAGGVTENDSGGEHPRR